MECWPLRVLRARTFGMKYGVMSVAPSCCSVASTMAPTFSMLAESAALQDAVRLGKHSKDE